MKIRKYAKKERNYKLEEDKETHEEKNRAERL